MANKINFRKLHLAIPLLLLPFIFIFYYLFFSKKQDASTEVVVQEEKAGFNSQLPGAKDGIENQDRLQAYQDALRKRRLNTGMKDINPELGNQKLLDEGAESFKDSIMNKISDEIKENQARDLSQRRKDAAAKAKESRQKLADLYNRGKSSTPSATAESETKPNPMSAKEKEMESFKQQMRYVDSLSNPEKYTIEETAVETEETKTYEISRESGVATNGNYFNTIKADLGKTLITAILDEGIKAWEGSRVRIRLLEPIFIDGRLLDKGQYLYGIVTSFASQRLLITVSSVVINGEIFPLNLSLYDNDGIEGIYIPDSAFRTFSKELGANTTRGTVQNQNGANSDTQALYQSVSSAVQSSTRAVQQALRKNKARLKYNTQVFLVNSDN